MRPIPALTIAGAVLASLAGAAQAAPSAAQLCEAAAEVASAKFAKCRLDAEAKNAKGTLVGQRFTDALGKCSMKLSDAFTKALTKYGTGNCPTEPSSEFDAFLAQCSDRIVAAAGGATFPVPGGAFPATGQTTCWDPTDTVQPISTISCAGTGQDGDVQAGAPLAYLDNGDGTVTDVNTGLMWEKLSDDGSIHDMDDALYTWATALTVKIAALNAGGFAGHTDWRLPNRRELESLVNLESLEPAVSPAFNTDCAPGCTVLTCSCSVSWGYWSSSTAVGNPASAWLVEAEYGFVDTAAKTEHSTVRAVRGRS